MLVQLLGSLLVLAAFALSQWGVLNAKSVVYLTLNTLGSAALAIEAFIGAQWGFLLLEAVWALVSAAVLASSYANTRLTHRRRLSQRATLRSFVATGRSTRESRWSQS